MIGFFGTDRNYYWWMSDRYKAGRDLSKCAYWQYANDMKGAQKAREGKRRYPKRGQ
jgi:hypothetical protein